MWPNPQILHACFFLIDQEYPEYQKNFNLQIHKTEPYCLISSLLENCPSGKFLGYPNIKSSMYPMLS